MDEEFIRALSFIKSSLYRQKVLECINSVIKTPSEIAKDLDIRLNHVSMYLGELKKEGLVSCLNENSKKGRLYQLTELGQKVLEIIKEKKI